MRRVFTPHTELLRQLIERSEDLGARLQRGSNMELEVEVTSHATVEPVINYNVMLLQPREGSKVSRLPMDEISVTLRNTLYGYTEGQLRLYLMKRNGRQYDSMHHFEYATRGDLLRLAADKITAKIQEFLVDGEFSFAHQTTWTTNDNDRTIYLRKTQGSAIIG